MVKQSVANQSAADELGRWMKGDIKESDELYSLFRKYYGMGQGTGALKDYESQFKETMKNFQASFKEFLPILGVVSKAEYDHLHRQFEELKEKAAGLEKEVESLRKRLSGNPEDPAETAQAFDQIIKTQTDQFQKLMNTFTGMAGIPAQKDEKK